MTKYEWRYLTKRSMIPPSKFVIFNLFPVRIGLQFHQKLHRDVGINQQKGGNTGSNCLPAVPRPSTHQGPWLLKSGKLSLDGVTHAWDDNCQSKTQIAYCSWSLDIQQTIAYMILVFVCKPLLYSNFVIYKWYREISYDIEIPNSHAICFFHRLMIHTHWWTCTSPTSPCIDCGPWGALQRKGAEKSPSACFQQPNQAQTQWLWREVYNCIGYILAFWKIEAVYHSSISWQKYR